MSDSDVVVTGLGMVTAAGLGTTAAWESVCAGRATASRRDDLAGLPVDFACSVPAFDPLEIVGRRSRLVHDRFVQLALIAAREAVSDSALDRSTWTAARVGVVVGGAFGGVGSWERQHRAMVDHGADAVSPLFIPMMMLNMVAGHIAMDLGVTGPNLVTATACASGSSAVGTGLDLITSGKCDVVIAGGSEASITPLIISGFARMGALSRRSEDPAAASRPFDADRDGFVLGEGSGFLVLEKAADARARGARKRATLAGYGASADAYHVTTPDPSGKGALSALGQALAAADIAPGEVDYVNAHGTSTKINDVTEARIIASGLSDRAAVSSTKGVTGHTLGAAGAIEAALTVLSIEHNLVPPTANVARIDPAISVDVVFGSPRQTRIDVAVSNSFGFGGQNAVLVFTA